MSIVRIEGLCKKYSGSPYQALVDFGLKVERGELIALVGESGSGKTTVLRLIAGFEKPTAGSIWLDGKSVCGHNGFVPAETRGIGMVFQDYALFPHLRVHDNIAFGLRNRSDNSSQVVAQMLKLVELEGYEARYPHELSGGQQQRVAIARALAPRPDVLLLDEPLSNLDDLSKARVRDELHDIIRRAQTTAIWVSHDMKHMMAVVDRIAIIKEGRLQQIGHPEQVYRQPCNHYVAGIFGKTNIFQARIVDKGIETPIGLFDVKDVGIIGETIEVAIRPEHFTVVEKGQSPINGIVKRIHFQGEYSEVLVEIDTYELSIYVESDQQIATGKQVFLLPNSDKLQFLSMEPETNRSKEPATN